MKKTVFTLNVNGYSKEITDLTYPLLKYWTHKIGAEFFEIKERKYPDMPVVYEKIQIYDLGREMKNDWNIYIDSDALIHPETIDWTLYLKKDTVAHNGNDMANVRWRYDKYFMRDGRQIGSCNWHSIASDWCIDLWHPLEIPLEEALDNIYPTVMELNTIITKEHLIDDYTLSRNIAKYGLKFKKLQQLQIDVGLPDAYFFWHEYVRNIEEKINGWEEEIWNEEKQVLEKKHINGIKGILDLWRIPKNIREYGNY
jgi:hypothetical protein